MHRNFGIAGGLACAFALLVPANNLLADDPQDEDAGERCVSLQRIDRTEILDDQTILVYMRDGDIYRNRLRNRCPSLRDNRPIMYSTTTSQLCDLDRITVLYSRGAGFTPGGLLRAWSFSTCVGGGRRGSQSGAAGTETQTGTGSTARRNRAA